MLPVHDTKLSFRRILNLNDTNQNYTKFWIPDNYFIWLLKWQQTTWRKKKLKITKFDFYYVISTKEETNVSFKSLVLNLYYPWFPELNSSVSALLEMYSWPPPRSFLTKLIFDGFVSRDVGTPGRGVNPYQFISASLPLWISIYILQHHKGLTKTHKQQIIDNIT